MTCKECTNTKIKALGLCRKHYLQVWKKENPSDDLVREIDRMNLPTDVIPIQKSMPPYIPVGKYGFMGLLLLDTKVDKIQCHVCGYWYHSLGRHVKAHHGINHREYKTKYGLYLGEPLNSLGYTRKLKRMRARRKGYVITQKDRDKAVRVGKNGMKTEQWKNKFGTCEAQLKFRVDEHIKKYGKFPTFRTDQKLDAVLRYRFGSIDNAKIYYKYETN